VADRTDTQRIAAVYEGNGGLHGTAVWKAVGREEAVHIQQTKVASRDFSASFWVVTQRVLVIRFLWDS
jgi:hypothetical protein